MPTLVRLDGVLIRMFSGDHHPPHFHVWTASNGEAQILLSDLSVTRGNIRRQELELALAWARANMSFLNSESDRLMVDDDFISVGVPLPRILSVRPLVGRQAHVVWADGSEQAVDLAPAIMSHRGFIPLRTDDKLFAQMAVSDTFDSIIWPDGSELSAAWIEELAPVTLDNAAFRQAMDELRFSLDGMAARLGVARRLVADYRKDKPIPPVVALATRYLMERHRRLG